MQTIIRVLRARVGLLVVSALSFQPLQAAEVGTMAGTFAVGASGSASYSIPVSLPPGAGGMAPGLSLEFDSQANNGQLGMGFTLRGLSQISRCMTNLDLDGLIDPVDFDSNDRFCYDGQRLVATSGTYGAVGTEYRTETDAFSRVVSYGGTANSPGYFQVSTKSGEIIEFGNTADSRREAISPAGTPRTQAFSWNVNKITDAAGNYVLFNYYENTAGEHRPTSIQYTGNTVAGVAPSASVEFAYEPRPDAFTHYGYGTRFAFSQRLSLIRTKANGVVAREYTLTYEMGSATKASRIKQVQECTGTGYCLNPTVFTWQEGGAGVLASASSYTASSFHEQSSVHSQDFTGDGVADLLFHNGTTGATYLHPVASGVVQAATYTASSFHEGHGVYPGDFNADGVIDLAFFDSGLGTLYVHPVGNGVIQSPTYTAGSFHEGSRVFVGDYNGDGYKDLLFWNINNGGIYVHPVVNGVVQAATFAATSYHEKSDVIVGDFNGDGVSDVAFFNKTSGGIYVHLVSNGVLQAASYVASSFHEASELNVGEFNGDGQWDLAFWNKASGRLYIHLMSEGVPRPAIIFADSLHEQSDLSPADFNHDGITDLFFKSDLGRVFVHTILNGVIQPATFQAESMHEASLLVANDFNGDGITDAAFWNPDIGRLDIHPAVGGVPDYLTAITDGLGALIQIAYQAMTQGSVYTKGAGSAYPVMEMQAPQYVVSSTGMSDGMGGLRTTSYKYTASRTHLRGRGTLGFARREILDETTGIWEVTDFNQVFPYTGTPLRSVKRTGNGSILAESETALSHVTLGSGSTTTRFIYPAKLIERRWETSGGNYVVTTKVTENVYGEPQNRYSFFGNLTRVTISAYVGHEAGNSPQFVSTNTNTFCDGLPCPFGLLTRSQIARTAPGDSAAIPRTSTFEYDATTGLLLAETVEPDNPALKLRTAYVRDAFGNIIQTTQSGADITSATTREEFSAAYPYYGRFNTKTINALGHEETHTFDPATGNVTSITSSNGLLTLFQHDALGRPKGETFNQHGVSTSSAVERRRCTDNPGVCWGWEVFYVWGTDISGGDSFAFYDLVGREVRRSAKSANGRHVEVLTEYYPDGQVKRISSPQFRGSATTYWTTFTYDNIGRVQTKTEPVNQSAQRTITTAYAGLVTTETINGRTMEREANALGKMVRSRDAAGGQVLMTYDAFENLLTTRDPAGNLTSMVYDLRGRRSEMTEPNMGHWKYGYNVLGQLVRQEDAKGQITTMLYDVLGRMTQRDEAAGVTTWTFDTKWKGAIASVTSPGYQRSYDYELFGAVKNEIITIVNTSGGAYTRTLSYAYDTQGRAVEIRYPNTFTLRNTFNEFGALYAVSNAGTGQEYWRANDWDEWGNVYRNRLGNSVETWKYYDVASGRLDAILAGPNGATSTQSLDYQWDVYGNLISRRDNNQSLTETFTYDELDRVTQSTLSGLPGVGGPVINLSVAYTSVGNIATKSGVGTYTYGAKPNAVTGAGGVSYSYDANGNMLTASSRTYSWTSFNLPSRISEGGTTVDFVYGPERQRIRQMTGSRTIYYFDGLYEEHYAAGATEKKYSINTPQGVVAIETIRDGAPTRTEYVHKDHLGSIEAISDASGQVVQRLSYDAFGKRRASNWQDESTAIDAILLRGYTGHEMLDDFGLIHMNGRVYDPLIGRFISADQFVQEGINGQSHNRYSYVMNNPLTLVDPSGYFSSGLGIGRFLKNNARHVIGAITGGVNYLSLAGADHQIRNSATWRMIYGVAASVYGGPLGAGAYSGYVTKRMGGTWRQAFRTAVTSTLSSAVGDSVGSHYGNNWSVGRVVASSIAGGVSAEIQGGSFRDGFRTSFVLASLSYLNVKMREAMIKQSEKNPENINGESEGLNGDGKKLAGARRAYVNGKPMPCTSPLGGCQGAPRLDVPGDQRSNFLGILAYEPGSALDQATESFAGPHDYLRNLTNAYNDMGNSIANAGWFQEVFMNGFLLIPAAPFAAATWISPAGYAVVATQPWEGR